MSSWQPSNWQGGDSNLGDRTSGEEAIESESRRDAPRGAGRIPVVTIPALTERKQSGRKIAAVTAYDYPSARLADEAGLDVILVGDSLAMVVLGHPSTLPVTMEEMLVFTAAARRGVRRALLVADMPFGSYGAGTRTAVRNAVRFVKEAGAQAVKLEGGQERAGLVRRMVGAEIPVMGHIGLTPQAVHRMGGYKVQGRTAEGIARLRADAQALAEAGCFALVLEGIPREVAAEITGELPIPTIGIGAGPACDGQILVWHDLLGIVPDEGQGGRPAPKFVRRFGEIGHAIDASLVRFRDAVQRGTFPAEGESYHLQAGVPTPAMHATVGT